MVLSNAERQARYRQRLKDAARPAWVRRDYATAFELGETIGWFREFFGRSPLPDPVGLQLYSRREPDGVIALLAKLPWPLGEADAGIMKDWRLAPEEAKDLGSWRREV